MPPGSMITPGSSEMIMKMLTMTIVGVALVTAGSVRVSRGQMLPQQFLPWSNQISAGISQLDIIRHTEQQKLRIAERQKRLEADTEKLVALTTALKAQVDESNKDILSIDMIKKAEEIEKLARSVKERIKE
jgi:Tfp pilus assembly protein PilN